MRIATLLRYAVLGLAALVTAGLLAFQQPGSASADDGPVFKRDEDGAELAVVAEDDEADDDDDLVRAADTNTRTRSRASRNTRSDHSRTGRNSGRDNSRSGRKVKDWTRDGGDRTRDWSQNRTNDRSRNNTL